jgi:tetratricopeptide (TPR) repeat protein/predicted Ser/Thr protein kinase
MPIVYDTTLHALWTVGEASGRTTIGRRILRFIYSWYWDGILEIPLGILEDISPLDLETAWKVTAWKAGFTILFLLFLYELYLRFKMYRREKRNRAEYKAGIKGMAQQGAYLAKDTEFTETLEAISNPEQTIAELKRTKEFGRLGEVFVALGRHKEAAKAFRKAGDLNKAAAALAKGGWTLKAAKLLMKAGDYATAARFYTEKGKHIKAARAYDKHNDLPNAARAYALAGKHAEATSNFKEYFSTTKDEAQRQVSAAELCYQLLDDPSSKDNIEPDDRKILIRAVAERFDAAQRSDLAARLFREVGELVRAGKIYLRAGHLEEAAQCMKAAGNAKEASEIGGRYYEAREDWQNAAVAYEQAGNFKRSGDCYVKALDPIKAAECYEKANEFFGAGFSLVHSDKWESAIRMFQQVQEDNPKFGESRALLGRCFYELKDYAHCAASLDNYLTGERVRTGNIEYFWMLALAYEQLGQLEKSKEVLLKIRSVKVGFRDVGQRLSNIQSRISIVGPDPGTMVPNQSRPSDQATAVMTMVEDQLGQRYKLERELGRGGMGVVYLAKDNQLDRPVALKFLGSLVDGNEEYKKRFVREAKAAAQVSHPNIISIYEISVQDGNSFIAMEFVEGKNLHQYVQEKEKLAAREAVNIMIQACSALDAIHEKGIVHRDIKPDNILIAKGGLVKLMDFGLAKGQGSRLTGANVVMGTPSYMAPEQGRGEDVDARADIYAIGLVLHEMLTGETVFLDGDVMKRHQVEMPDPPGSKVEGVPELLDQIVMKCVAKKPEERFATTKELVGYLRQVGKPAQ